MGHCDSWPLSGHSGVPSGSPGLTALRSGALLSQACRVSWAVLVSLEGVILVTVFGHHSVALVAGLVLVCFAVLGETSRQVLCHCVTLALDFVLCSVSGCHSCATHRNSLVQVKLKNLLHVEPWRMPLLPNRPPVFLCWVQASAYTDTGSLAELLIFHCNNSISLSATLLSSHFSAGGLLLLRPPSFLRTTCQVCMSCPLCFSTLPSVLVQPSLLAVCHWLPGAEGGASSLRLLALQRCSWYP